MKQKNHLHHLTGLGRRALSMTALVALFISMAATHIAIAKNPKGSKNASPAHHSNAKGNPFKFGNGNKKKPILPQVRLRRHVRSAPPRGNNGIGQEKRGLNDGAPPGLIKNGKGDFNDGPGNRHGV